MSGNLVSLSESGKFLWILKKTFSCNLRNEPLNTIKCNSVQIRLHGPLLAGWKRMLRTSCEWSCVVLWPKNSPESDSNVQGTGQVRNVLFHLLLMSLEEETFLKCGNTKSSWNNKGQRTAETQYSSTTCYRNSCHCGRRRNRRWNWASRFAGGKCSVGYC